MGSAFTPQDWLVDNGANSSPRGVDGGGADLELLARSTYMLGRDDEYVGALERAHSAYLDADDVVRAVRCTFWIGHNWLFRGEPRAPAGGSVAGRGCSKNWGRTASSTRTY